jgi:hypothetical protein
MNFGGAIYAAGKQGTIYIQSVTDGSLRYVGSRKMWDGSSNGETPGQSQCHDYLRRKRLQKQ